MNYMKRLFLAFAFVFVCTGIFAADDYIAHNLSSIPVEYQGKWVVMGYSEDGGTTFNRQLPGVTLCEVGSSVVISLIGDPNYSKTTKIVRFTNRMTREYFHVIRLANEMNTTWQISVLDYPFIKLDVLDPETFNIKTVMLVRIDKQ